MPSRLPKSFLRNIKLILEYDGSKFFGFQRQPSRPTVQEALETALSKLFNRPMKILAAAGRTDSGVHALGQIVNFKTDSRLPLEKIQKGLNTLLPAAVAVKKIEAVPAGFHARYGAKWKTYRYEVLNSAVRAPLLNGKVYRFPYRLNFKVMCQAARSIVGRHDFKAFQAAGSKAKDSVRRVRRLSLKRKGERLQFQIEADGFLYHMVRNLVGTLLEVGRGALTLEDFREILKKRSRPLAGPTVPGYALILVSVQY